MATLFELNEQIKNFQWEIDEETGEILNEKDLDTIEMEFSDKIENLALWVLEMETDADAYEKYEKKFANLKKRTNKKIDSVKRYLASVLDGNKFKTDKINIGWRKSEKLEIAEGTEVPLEYLVAQEPKIDKVGLKKAIKEGATFTGITLVESNNIQVK